jgi:hypothetical protein
MARQGSRREKGKKGNGLGAKGGRDGWFVLFSDNVK